MATTIALTVNPRASIVVLRPKNGLSTLYTKGEPFWDPMGDTAPLTPLKKYLNPRIPVIGSDAYISDSEFA